MKQLNVTLSLYLLVLAMLPCTDGMALGESHILNTQQLEVNHADEHEHDKGVADHCSPLCACSCCHITIRPPADMTWGISFTPMLGEKLPHLYSNLYGLTDSDDIWQPPKFS